MESGKSTILVGDHMFQEYLVQFFSIIGELFQVPGNFWRNAFRSPITLEIEAKE